MRRRIYALLGGIRHDARVWVERLVGRSSGGQNRQGVETGRGIKVEAFDPSMPRGTVTYGPAANPRTARRHKL